MVTRIATEWSQSRNKNGLYNVILIEIGHALFKLPEIFPANIRRVQSVF